MDLDGLPNSCYDLGDIGNFIFSKDLSPILWNYKRLYCSNTCSLYEYDTLCARIFEWDAQLYYIRMKANLLSSNQYTYMTEEIVNGVGHSQAFNLHTLPFTPIQDAEDILIS